MIIAILHAEKQLQLKDLTRFDASKSVLVKGSVNPINSVKIKAGADGTDIEIFNTISKNWYVDFVFSEYKFDVDATNSKLHFESGGVNYSTIVANGTYTLADLLTAIKTAIELMAPITVSFAVDERNKITITSSVAIKISPKFTSADIFQHLGFKEVGQLIGTPVEYGIRKVTLTIASISESNSIDHYLEVYTQEGDALFSEDADLVGYESDIMKWLPQGRGTFLDLHRKAQRLIIDWMDRKGYRDDKNAKLTKFAFVDNTDVRVWATYMTLKLFFMGAQNATDDVFKRKSEYYAKLEIEARDRTSLTLDLNGDGKKDKSTTSDIGSGRLFFR